LSFAIFKKIKKHHMEKKFLQLTFIFVIFFLTSNCFSQRKGYVAISGGPSFPTGDFTDINSYAPAKTGYNFSIMFNKTEWDNIGFSSMIFGQIIPVDVESILGVTNTLTSGTSVDVTIDADDWIFGGLMAGGYGSFPMSSSSVNIEALLMIGGLYTKFPGFTVTASSGSNSESASTTGSSAYSFAYMIVGGINFAANEKVCLLFDLSYLGSTPEYENLSVTSVTINTTTVSQTVGTYNLSFGVGLIL